MEKGALSHDGSVIRIVLLEGLIDVVVAHSAMITVAALPSPAALGTVRISRLARLIAHAAPGTVLAGVVTAGEAPSSRLFFN